jgi:hypothetical protein
MAEINTQSIVFSASGLLSQATGANGVGFPMPATTVQGLTDQASLQRKIRIQGVRVVGAPGSSQVYDATAADTRDADIVFEGVIPTNGGSDGDTNLGVNIKTGDVYVQVGAGQKVFLYIDLNS